VHRFSAPPGRGVPGGFDTSAGLVVTITQRADAIRIAVANPGATIRSPHLPHLPHLFDRSCRVDSSRHDAGQIHGHGLGLAVAKSVAAMHRGATLATSDAGLKTIAFSIAG
jgi:two-component system heavy metal sensor histidine kinase CusS